MAVFTLEELKKLKEDNIFLAHVDYVSQNKGEQFLNFQKALEDYTKQEQYYIQLNPKRESVIKQIFNKERENLLKKFNLAATILYKDQNGYVDLLSNEYLSKEDIVLEDSLFPIASFLEDKALEYSVCYENVPFKCYARVNDERFSYYDKKIQDYVPGSILRTYFESYQDTESLKEIGKPVPRLEISKSEEDNPTYIRITNRIEDYIPHYDNNQLKTLDKSKIFCGIIEYQKPYKAMSLAHENNMEHQLQKSLQIAISNFDLATKQFKIYKKKRQSNYYATNRTVYDQKLRFLQEREDELLAAIANSTSFLKYCQCCATFLYQDGQDWVDLYTNRTLREGKANLLEDTLLPALMYCKEQDLAFSLIRNPNQSYQIIDQPIVHIQSGFVDIESSLLDAFGTIYYRQNQAEEIMSYYREVVKKR